MTRIAQTSFAFLLLYGSAAGAEECVWFQGRCVEPSADPAPAAGAQNTGSADAAGDTGAAPVEAGACEPPQFKVGHFYVGALYSLGVGALVVDGSAWWGWPKVGIGLGLNLGFKMPSRNLWWEIGLAIGPFQFSGPAGVSAGTDYNYVGGGGVPIAADLRLLAPIRAPWVYWAGTFEPGVFVHSFCRQSGDVDDCGPDGCGSCEDGVVRATFNTAIRGGFAFVLGDWVEIRLDVIGLELIFEKAFGVLYSPSFAVVLRI